MTAAAAAGWTRIRGSCCPAGAGTANREAAAGGPSALFWADTSPQQTGPLRRGPPRARPLGGRPGQGQEQPLSGDHPPSSAPAATRYWRACPTATAPKAPPKPPPRRPASPRPWPAPSPGTREQRRPDGPTSKKPWTPRCTPATPTPPGNDPPTSRTTAYSDAGSPKAPTPTSQQRARPQSRTTSTPCPANSTTGNQPKPSTLPSTATTDRACRPEGWGKAQEPGAVTPQPYQNVGIDRSKSRRNEALATDVRLALAQQLVGQQGGLPDNDIAASVGSRGDGCVIGDSLQNQGQQPSHMLFEKTGKPSRGVRRNTCV